MVRSRMDLETVFREILQNNHCYFDPPDSIQMKYPCICYVFSNFDVDFADNKSYLVRRRYIVTVIDEDPDSPIPEKLLLLPYCTSDRTYVADNLYHFVFTLFY